jgi:hypothetical protein
MNNGLAILGGGNAYLDVNARDPMAENKRNGRKANGKTNERKRGRESVFRDGQVA